MSSLLDELADLYRAYVDASNDHADAEGAARRSKARLDKAESDLKRWLMDNIDTGDEDA